LVDVIWFCFVVWFDVWFGWEKFKRAIKKLKSKKFQLKNFLNRKIFNLKKFLKIFEVALSKNFFGKFFN